MNEHSHDPLVGLGRVGHLHAHKDRHDGEHSHDPLVGLGHVGHLYAHKDRHDDKHSHVALVGLGATGTSTAASAVVRAPERTTQRQTRP